MNLDQSLEKTLCERLCEVVRVHRRDDRCMLDTPFRFPDGDHYSIYITGTDTGGVQLSDQGHTLMHLSYEHDVDALYKGACAAMREQIMRETGVTEENGVFSMETSLEKIADAVFVFGQSLARIHDILTRG